MNDDDLEAMFRRGLEEHADDVTDRGGRAETAHAGVRRRRRLQAGIAVAAAVLILVPAAVVAAVNRTDQPADPVAVHPSSWRAESYNGVQLWVPPSWGWGGSPQLMGGRLTQCGDGAFAETTSSGDMRYPVNGDRTLPYVGRPLSMSDLCGSPPSAAAAHVWFGSPLPAGTGPTGETVRVDGLTAFNITVSDANAAERRAILGSIETVTTDANGCAARWSQTSWGQVALDPRAVRSVSVCVYYGYPRQPAPQRFGRGAEYLFYSAEVRADAPAVLRAIEATGPGRSVQPGSYCIGSTPAAVDLVAHAGDDSYVYAISPNSCPGQTVGYDGRPGFHILTKSSVRLWAIDGVTLYSKGGDVGNRLTPYLPGS